MTTRTEKTLIGRSIPSDLVMKIIGFGHTVSDLQGMSRTSLAKYYSVSEVVIILEKVRRNPIDDAVIEVLVSKSLESCAYCADGNSSRPYQIHHIRPHAISQDDSEGNLFLVCPTHHSVIHKDKLSEGDQQRKKSEWELLATIAGEYLKKGVPFPFGKFEAFNYSGKPNFGDVVNIFHVSPCTAVEIAKSAIGREAIEQLQRTNFVVLAGASGSGKSTLAAGIAGLSQPSGRIVLRFRGAGRPAAQCMNELLEILNVVTKPTVLLVEDLNSWGGVDELKTIAGAATPTVQVILIWTNDRSEQAEKMRMAMAGTQVMITWDKVLPDLKKQFLEHEGEIVTALAPFRAQSYDRIGYGPGYRRLEYLVDNYSQRASTVFQFIYLLRDVEQVIAKDLDAFFENGRADVPIFITSIEQIAGVEKPVTAEEVSAIILARLGKDFEAVQPQWARDVLDLAAKGQCVIRVPGGFSTIHREWARAFICEALANPKTQKSAEAVLEHEFALASFGPRRLVILISWLNHNAAGSRFLDRWIARLSREALAGYLTKASAASLHDVSSLIGYLSDRLSRFNRLDDLGTVVRSSIGLVSARLNEADAQSWYYVSELTNALRNACPDMLPQLFSCWEPKSAAEAICATDPDSLGYVERFFWNPAKHCPEWCMYVGKCLDVDKFINNLERISPGNLAVMEECVDILGFLKRPLMRSMVRKIVDVISAKVGKCNLDEIYGGSGRPWNWLEVFPDEMGRIVSGFDVARLTVQLKTSYPGEWRKMLEVCTLGKACNYDIGGEIMKGIELDFVERSKIYGERNPYEFRLLVWQLGYASAEKKKEFAKCIFETVRSICRDNQWEREFILKAFAFLDSGLSLEISKEWGLDKMVRESLGKEAAPRKIIDILGTQNVLARLESSGKDYDVDLVLKGIR